MAVHIGVKVAISLVSNPEQTKKLAGGILAVIVAVIALPSIILLGISTLLGQDMITEDYDIAESQIYQETFPVYREFMDAQTEAMIEQAEELVEEYTITEDYWVTLTDPLTGEEIRELRQREVCTIDVYVICNHMDYAYLLSYLSVHNEDIVSGEQYTLDEDEITDFLADIQEVQTEHIGSNYFIFNQFYATEDIVQIACGDDVTDQEYFLTTMRNYQEMIREAIEPENYHFGGADERYQEDGIEPGTGIENAMDIPQMYQYLGAWADYPYGNGTIRSSGCAIVCLAMVLSYLEDEIITPLDVVSFTGNQYYQPGAGSTWNIFPAVASHYGHSCNNLGKSSSAIISALESGQPVIASMGPGTFTRGGHFIVLKGITEDGKILVNDPNDNSTKNHNNTKFSMSLIMTEAKNFWSFY